MKRVVLADLRRARCRARRRGGPGSGRTPARGSSRTRWQASGSARTSGDRCAARRRSLRARAASAPTTSSLAPRCARRIAWAKPRAREAPVRHHRRGGAARAGRRRPGLPGRSRSRKPRSAGRSSTPPSFARAEDIAASRTAPSIVWETPSISFSAMLPVKPSVTITSALPPTRSPPSMLPTNSNATRPPRRAQRSSASVSHDRARCRARPPRRWTAARRAGARRRAPSSSERGAHERELHEVLAPRLGVRADVEQRHRMGARDGQRDAPARAGRCRARA